MKGHYQAKLKKTGGKFVHVKPADAVLYEQFKKDLPEGSVIEMIIQEYHDDGTLAQLAKLHAMIREIANHTGYTFNEVKLLTKDRAGLCYSYVLNGKELFECKSFGDCSKEELSLAIKACMEIGEQVNCPVS
jgi:hypothetical protein